MGGEPYHNNYPMHECASNWSAVCVRVSQISTILAVTNQATLAAIFPLRVNSNHQAIYDVSMKHSQMECTISSRV